MSLPRYFEGREKRIASNSLVIVHFDTLYIDVEIATNARVMHEAKREYNGPTICIDTSTSFQRI